MSWWKRLYQALMGSPLTFRNASREWLYLGFLGLVMIALAVTFALKR